MRVPDVSVVIATTRPWLTLGECLASLGRQRGIEHLQVLVVEGVGDGSVDRMCRGFPHTELVHGTVGASVPQLRGAGLARARGEVVAFLDPFCLPPPHWAAALATAHRRYPEPVIGGGVALADAHAASLTQWACYLQEYWEYVPPVADAPAPALSGNNLGYKRAALDASGWDESDGFWKSFVNEHLQRAGATLRMASDLTVALRKPISWRAFLRSRYHHGRAYAGRRVADAPWPRRAGRALTTPLLPLVFSARAARGLWRKPRARWKFVQVLPLLAPLHVSWAIGELCGYLCGSGQSDARLHF